MTNNNELKNKKILIAGPGQVHDLIFQKTLKNMNPKDLSIAINIDTSQDNYNDFIKKINKNRKNF